MYRYALGSFGMYMHVEAYFCESAIYDPLLIVECLSCSNCAHMAISSLICAWESCSLHLGSKTHFVIMNVHPMCYLVVEPKLLFAANALHVPCFFNS
jgi:hypothetical protein